MKGCICGTCKCTFFDVGVHSRTYKRMRFCQIGVFAVLTQCVLTHAVGALKIRRAAGKVYFMKASKYYCNGECDVERDRCSCRDGCRENRTCCTDYTESCEGGVSWKSESCTSAENMKCPAGYENTVMMLSIDGFRDIYLERELTPTISKLMKCGASAPYMIPTYPTKTFPNHYTIVTGLYPESHGIIANRMFNHDTEEEFQLGQNSSFNPDWWKGEPIWVTTSNAGLKSAAYFWPGSEVNITRYPDYWKKFDDSVDMEERVYAMLDWLDLDAQNRPKMILMYTSAVDTAGHNGGPYSKLVNTSLVETDKYIEMIMNGLRDRDLDTCINFILVSDHGMANMGDCRNKATCLDEYGVDISSVYLDTGPFARIGKNEDKALWNKFDPVDTKKKLECKREETHWEAFLKYEYLPKRFHYANNPWIEDLHLVMDPERWVVDTADSAKRCGPGEHGFDDLYEDQKSLFIGHGPDIKRRYHRDAPFGNIEVYNLLTDLLRIDAAENNGTHGALYDIMTVSPDIVKEDAGGNATSCPASDGNAGNLGCQGCEGVSNSEANDRLRSYESRAEELEKKHMLYGPPRIFDSEANFCMLYQKDFVTTYDKALRMPRIVSFVLNETSSWSNTPTCVRRDIRVADTSTTDCTEYVDNDDDISWSYLFYPNLSSDEIYSDATVTSNTIPIHKSFSKIWTYMQKELQRWANMYNGISAHVGPIFDYNYDGAADNEELRQGNGTFVTPDKNTAVPTHFFMVMTRCKDTSSGKTITECANDVNDIDVLSFIVPNYAEEPCHKSEEDTKTWIPRALERHIARIKDVELLTKSSFFTNWVASPKNSDESHLAAIRRKLYIPQQSSSWLNDFVTSTTPTPTTTSSGKTFPITPFTVVILVFVSYVLQ